VAIATEPLRTLARNGLLPGTSLRLHVDQQDSGDVVLATVVEMITGDRLEVLVPIFQRRMRPIAPGTVVRCEYFHRRKLHRFFSETLGHSADRAYEYLATPEDIEVRERRDAFRLETSIRPHELTRIVGGYGFDGGAAGEPIPATITDISVGGLCLMSSARFTAADRLSVHADLGDSGVFAALLRVVSIDPPPPGYRNRRVHCQFAEISKRDRDRIGRYLMKRQIEQRRDGTL